MTERLELRSKRRSHQDELQIIQSWSCKCLEKQANVLVDLNVGQSDNKSARYEVELAQDLGS